MFVRQKLRPEFCSAEMRSGRRKEPWNSPSWFLQDIFETRPEISKQLNQQFKVEKSDALHLSYQ
jgi:hypothetical protein